MMKYDYPNMKINRFDREAVATASDPAQDALTKWEQDKGATIIDIPFSELTKHITF